MEPVSDLIPTASTSTTGMEEEEEIPVKSEKGNVEIIPAVVEQSIPTTITTATTTVSTSTTRNKRRSQDEMISTNANNKKPRRMSKMRGRRVKV